VYPEIAAAYEQLGQATQEWGPLDKKTRELVKLGIAAGSRQEGAVHSHARRALDAGATPEEVRHVVLLALTTTGFPATTAALTWVEDVLPRDAAETLPTPQKRDADSGAADELDDGIDI
jgi:AhpD family alkylhydroperoxidase